MTEAHKLVPRLFTSAETLLNYSETLQHIILIFYHTLYGKQGLFSLYPSHLQQLPAMISRKCLSLRSGHVWRG